MHCLVFLPMLSASFPHNAFWSGLVLNLFIFFSKGISKVFLKIETVLSWQEDKLSQDALTELEPGALWGKYQLSLHSPTPVLLRLRSPHPQLTQIAVLPPSSADSLGAWIILGLVRAICRREQNVPKSQVFHPFSFALHHWRALCLGEGWVGTCTHWFPHR